MIIRPDESGPEEKQMVVQGYEIPKHQFSEHTEFLKYTNDFPIEREPDKKEFEERNPDFLRVINKYPGQSNIDAIDELRCDTIWKDMDFCQMWGTEGMRKRCERRSLRMAFILAVSRGRDGFGSKIQVTTRQEILAKEEKEKQKQTFGFFRHKKPEMQVQGEMQPQQQ